MRLRLYRPLSVVVGTSPVVIGPVVCGAPLVAAGPVVVGATTYF